MIPSSCIYDSVPICNYCSSTAEPESSWHTVLVLSKRAVIDRSQRARVVQCVAMRVLCVMSLHSNGSQRVESLLRPGYNWSNVELNRGLPRRWLMQRIWNDHHYLHQRNHLLENKIPLDLSDFISTGLNDLHHCFLHSLNGGLVSLGAYRWQNKRR